MMMAHQLFFYSDEHSRDLLNNEEAKILLVGGDLGYGNFGDVLQHLNAIKTVRNSTDLRSVSVFAANAIGIREFPARARSAYKSDAIIFFSHHPLQLSAEDPRLSLVQEIRNVSALWLYGGGFLNGFWGNTMLSLVEQFLRPASRIRYLVSGQQLTPPFQNRLLEHFRDFSPCVFGARDELSMQLLRESGIGPRFSFDDAAEELVELAARAGLRRGPGALVHLNSSSYTNDTVVRSGINSDLELLSSDRRFLKPVTLLQAYRDSRQEVSDTLQTICKLEWPIPLHDARLIDLVSLIFDESTFKLPEPITGEIGYSCSYHVALWLQLAGLPCWLRHSNSFYDQKAIALQMVGTLEEFISEPKPADHRSNLEQRAEWNAWLGRELGGIPTLSNVATISVGEGGPAPWPFFYKGHPTIEERLSELDDVVRNEARRADGAEAAVRSAEFRVGELQERIQTLTALNTKRLSELDDVVQNETRRADRAEAAFRSAEFRIGELQERIRTLTALTTKMGSDIRAWQRRVDAGELVTPVIEAAELATPAIEAGELTIPAIEMEMKRRPSVFKQSLVALWDTLPQPVQRTIMPLADVIDRVIK